MDTRLFERKPMLGISVLLLGTVLYTLLLPQALALGTLLLSPGFLTPLIGGAHLRFWVWDQLIHAVALLLISLPFAWVVARLYRHRPLAAALLLVAPTVIWMVLDYFAMRDQIPDAPLELNALYALDVAEAALVLPLLSRLLRPRPTDGAKPAPARP